MCKDAGSTECTGDCHNCSGNVKVRLPDADALLAELKRTTAEPGRAAAFKTSIPHEAKQET